MTDAQQKAAAKKFAADWKGKGYEKGQSQPFWLSLLRDVYGIPDPEQFIIFEEQVHLDHTSFIDASIPSTRVLIEQKSLDKDLKKPIKQSDGTLLTPFQQAKRYITELPLSQHPRWVVTCNFNSFFVYDMERPGGEPEEILLENLPTEYYRLSFLTDSGSEHLKREMQVSLAAGKIVGLLYDAFYEQYIDPTSERALKSLNVLCVRLVFCLYAEDAGIFGHHAMFHDYLAGFDTRNARRALIDLFQILDTLPCERDPYTDAALAAFPYVDGELFTDRDIEIPQFTDEIRELLLTKASANFNWSEISPTIFGAVFESTLNPETRRSSGMHYTSLENIHKVIDPLFLDGLKKEFEDICNITVEKTKMGKLRTFQKRLASLSFLDPACGSGNFLTETYLGIRRLENECLSVLLRGQISFGDAGLSPIQVTIGQFYGIEINDFAVAVAKTALWIAESQMMKETEMITHTQLNHLPLKTYANIVCQNALRLDWQTIVLKSKTPYIIGNPPFVGARMMKDWQKDDMLHIFKGYKNTGNLDYVSAWYFVAAEYLKDTGARAAFVSTNSITQGEQVAILWKPLFNMFGIHIDFAYRTFKWDSESTDKAAVYCVIISISAAYVGERVIYSGARRKIAANINPYLVDAPNIFVESRKKPICDVPEIGIGNKPIDGGNYLFTEAEKDEFIRKEPQAAKWFRPWIGADEFINGYFRYCLYLRECPPNELRKMPECMKRIEAVKNFRLASKSEGTRKIAETPLRFHVENMPDSDYCVVPSVSSENRRYIPIGFMNNNIIASNLVLIIPNATLYHFGILTSNVHMAWVRAVCGRLEMRYRYSKDIVYNNFPWPTGADEQQSQIVQLAGNILDARSKFPESSLADLYDERVMPTELLNAHRELDRAVMKLYGFPVKDFTEADCVAALMERYREFMERKQYEKNG